MKILKIAFFNKLIFEYNLYNFIDFWFLYFLT